MRITAVSGWALPCTWFAEQIIARFKNSQVKVLYPKKPFDPEEAQTLLEEAPADLYLGYSLGSLWLLNYRDFIPSAALKGVLAPFLAFSREQAMGGKTRITQLKYLTRILKRNPENSSPLIDFYANCNFPYPKSFLRDLPNHSALIEGLKFLQSASVSSKAVKNFKAIVGEKDIFLDAEKLKKHIPHLQVVKEAGHAPGPLLDRLVKLFATENQKVEPL